MVKKDYVLKDQKLQNLLEEDGYIIVPFLSNNEIIKLKEFFYSNYKQENGLQFTSLSNDIDLKKIANENIIKATKSSLEKYLIDYKIFMCGFVVKHIDKNSELIIHQDMTLVDESRFTGINIWIPLCDTNKNNGALHLIKGSHRLFSTFRNANIENIYAKHYNIIKEYLKPIYIKAGHAIIFDNSIIHYSPPNTSKEIRIAVNLFMAHKEAKITIPFYDKEKNKIELFEQEDDFFFKYQQFGGPNKKEKPLIGKSIGFKDYDFPIVTPSLLEEKYGKLSIFSKLRILLSKIREK